MVLLASGVGLTIISFLFISPYFGFYAYKQFENMTVEPIGVYGLQNPLNLYVL